MLAKRKTERGFFDLLYTHNPFYLLSVSFVLHGTAYAFHNGTGPYNPWPLMGLVVGYILLMAVTAFVIVRFGNVWDDARSIFLILVALFVELSLTTDDVLVVDRALGRLLLLGAFVISVLVTEGLLIGLRIRLPSLYRLPLHLILALLFLYPLVLMTAAFPQDDVQIAWRIFLFFPCAGLLQLTLIPATRRGPDVVARNGTPWRWPYFPWVLFGFVATALCVRGYAISLSFDPFSLYPNRMQGAFGSYFLVPVLLAAAILVLEIGKASKSEVIQHIALAVPACCFLLAFPAQVTNRAYTGFLAMFVDKLGSPVLVTWIGASLFYAYATVRGLRLAASALFLALLMGSIVDAQTVSLSTLADPQSTLIWLAAGIELLHGVLKRNSRHTLLAIICAAVALTIGAWADWPEFRRIIVFLHLVAGSILVVSVIFHDQFARFLQQVGAVLLIGLAGAAVLLTFVAPEDFADWRTAIYLVVLITVSFAYAYARSRFLYFVAGLISVAVGMCGAIIHLFVYLRHIGEMRGVGSIVIGLLFFGLAAGISACKAGFVRKAVTAIPLPGSNRSQDREI